MQTRGGSMKMSFHLSIRKIRQIEGWWLSCIEYEIMTLYFDGFFFGNILIILWGQLVYGEYPPWKEFRLTISPVLKATQVLEWSSVCFSAPPFHGFFDAPNPIARPQAQWQSDHPFFSLAEAPPWTSALLLIPRLAPPFTQQAAIQHAHRRRQQQQEPSRGIFLPYSSWVMSPFRRTMLASSVLFCSYWIVLASSGSGTGNAWCT